VQWPVAADRALVEVLRGLPALPASATLDVERVLGRAELHGVAGVVEDAAARVGALPPDLKAEIARRALARELDYDAHLALLRDLGARLEEAGMRAIALKGPLLGERLYERPSGRATSDVDLLVREADVERTVPLLEGLGYRLADSPEEVERQAREHHHWHFSHPHALPLELHFHAYRGFGCTLRSDELLARSEPAVGFGALRVLDPVDEIVFLAVHAAAHRFVRLGWLLDILLLARRLSPEARREARRRADAAGFGSVLAFTARLLLDILGAAPADVIGLGTLGGVRGAIVRRVAFEHERPVVRSMTRFVYTTALCDTLGAAARYATSSTGRHARALVGLRG
jgi:hypothetical protein